MQQRNWHHVTDLTRRTIFDAVRVGKSMLGALGTVT
jgi:hypothetical protein